MKPESRPLEARVARRFLPFAAVGLLALFATTLPPQPENWTLVWIAAALTFLIMAVGILTPWSRLPRWTYLVPPLAYFAVVALLREASDGSVSGYSPLAILPLVWIALNLGRREVAIGIAAGASVIVVPLVIGHSESYSVADWRRALLWTAVAAIVGFSVESLMRSKRAQTRAAREHERTIEAIAGVMRALTAETDARDHICRATREISGAAVAVIYEPDGSGDLILTGRAGPDPGRPRLPLRGEPSGSARAFSTGERYFVADAVGDTSLPQDAVSRTGSVSMLFEPIVRGDVPIGVLSVGWSQRIEDVDAQTTEAVGLLAIEAAVAIERSDLLARLSTLADTDGLTGLPNRRAWEETIRRTVSEAAITGGRLCVAVIDLDHFKDYNDRYGHQSGDRFLKSAAAAWRTALRQTDTLARYGGEEFIVALPRCSLHEAELVLERLRERTPEDQTCSVGVAEWDAGEPDVELVARADAALYEAKRVGRDTLIAAA